MFLQTLQHSHWKTLWKRCIGQIYLQKFPGCHYYTCGFVVNNDFSFIGATPDARICDNGIVEIKYPFSARNNTISEACDKIKDFYLLLFTERCYWCHNPEQKPFILCSNSRTTFSYWLQVLWVCCFHTEWFVCWENYHGFAFHDKFT